MWAAVKNCSFGSVAVCDYVYVPCLVDVEVELEPSAAQLRTTGHLV